MKDSGKLENMAAPIKARAKYILNNPVTPVFLIFILCSDYNDESQIGDCLFTLFIMD